MVNLASTERFLEVQPEHKTLGAFEAGLDASDPAITPAMRYFYAANKLGIPYCNFTPSLTNVPALSEHASEMGNPFAGMDGKTGQTLVKTALAAMFRVAPVCTSRAGTRRTSSATATAWSSTRRRRTRPR